MSNTPFEYESEEDILSDLDILLTASAKQILNLITAEDFLNWGKTSFPVLAPDFFVQIPSSETAKLAFWFALNIWNNSPLPDNNFKPKPIPKPKRNDSCPCGSGYKYKQCCSNTPLIPDLNSDMMWPYFCSVLSKSAINKIIKSGKLPTRGIIFMAEHLFENEDYHQVIKLLEPLFAGKASRVNQHHTGALDMLCDAYNYHYKTDNKKRDLLQRMGCHSNRTIRAEAWQRLSSIRQDAGDIPGARAALTEAMRADPDNPSHSLLELIHLIDSNEIELARQRAKFWLYKLRHHQDDYPDLIDILTLAQTDPIKALQKTTQSDDERLNRLLSWVESLNQYDIPLYNVIAINNTESQESILSTISIGENSITLQADLFDGETDAPEEPEIDPLENAFTLTPTKTIAALELKWQDVTPIAKPFSVDMEAFDGDEIWYDHENVEWLNFLLANPQTADSLDILDDIATMIHMHPDNEFLWGPMHHQLKPLLTRALNITEKAIDGKETKVPWLILENRPALRLWARNIHLELDNKQNDEATNLMQGYMSLNPGDNHGYRSLLVNQYLQKNMDTQALELTKLYPNDMQAEITYGKVLAHYRLGQLEQAQKSLLLAYKDLPLVADYLIKSRVRMPKINEESYIVGGKDQAWLYRDAMRETWQATPGCLEWLKKSL